MTQISKVARGQTLTTQKSLVRVSYLDPSEYHRSY